MANSMTGFGQGSNEYFFCEIRSLNHKFCEIGVKLPSQLNILEDKIREYIKQKIARGRVFVFIRTEASVEAKRDVTVNLEAARAYLSAINQLSASLNLENDLKASHLLNLNDIITIQRADIDLDSTWENLKNAIDMALISLLEMKAKEGKELVLDISNRVSEIEEIITTVNVLASGVVDEYREKLTRRLSVIMPGQELDEARLAMEVAILADKSDITEELVRLSSHLAQIKETLSLEEPMGRQLGFLSQEVNREINTISAKTSNLKITQLMLKAKNELEKIKEQLQNVE
ncbi:MAG: YicC/YloC family endoribonuclease [bacterium]|nr:YicC/YloC family endoribonuclease [bacterium]